MVMWLITSRDPERSRSWPRYIYLEIGWRYSLGSNGPPIGNGPLVFDGHMTQKARSWPRYLRPIISKTVGDTDLVPMEHLLEMATWEPNGHVTDDVTWPWKVKVVTLICLGLSISKTAGLESNGPPIGNGPLRFEWWCDWWCHVTQKGQGHDPDIFGAH